MTIGVIRLLGGDFGRTALVGFDDFPLADLLRPGLSVVAQGEERDRQGHHRPAPRQARGAGTRDPDRRGADDVDRARLGRDSRLIPAGDPGAVYQVCRRRTSAATAATSTGKHAGGALLAVIPKRGQLTSQKGSASGMGVASIRL